MADTQNTDQGTTDQVQAQAQAAAANTDATATAADDTTPVRIFATKAEADAARPADAAKGTRAYEATKAGTVLGWINARSYDAGLAALARKDGYSLSTGGKEVTKETIAARLASFTDDELAAMGLTRKKGKK